MIQLENKKAVCACGHNVATHNGSNWGTAFELSKCLDESCKCLRFGYGMSVEEAYKEVDDFLRGF